MFDTLMLIEKDHEFYAPSIRRMYRYLCSQGVNVPFEKFEQTYICERDKLFKQADLTYEEPHFNVRVAATLKALGYNYDVSSPTVTAATSEFCEEFMNYVKIDPDAEATLKTLHKTYRLGMISNFAIPECVLKLLKAGGIDTLFAVIVISGAVNRRKPHEEIFKSTLKLMNLNADEAVFVGDTIDADIEGAKAVGIKAVYIERRVQKASQKFLPDRTIKRLSDLPAALVGL
jgi:haloacid dehalogenase superfamily, subfamily IA, variant 3 with third motif having DD or ED/haloacid dehalogenase superfamily, subfamily IA, variant 1 with third motif having Dx(3-4)D or Dx(3-4)E